MANQPFIPQDDRPEISLSELLDIQTRTVYGRMSVGMVAEVRSWDRETQTCSVRPVAHQRYQNGDTESLPTIPRVPIRYPQGGRFVMTWPLKRGDFVWLDFGERSLEEWKATASADYAPRNKRRFDLSDAVAYAGIASPADPVESSVVKENAMVLGHRDGCRIEIYEGETLIGSGATIAVALAKIVDDMLGAIDTALGGWTPVGGDGGAALKAAYLAAIAALAPPIVTGAVPSAAASKTKAE